MKSLLNLRASGPDADLSFGEYVQLFALLAAFALLGGTASALALLLPF